MHMRYKYICTYVLYTFIYYWKHSFPINPHVRLLFVGRSGAIPKTYLAYLFNSHICQKCIFIIKRNKEMHFLSYFLFLPPAKLFSLSFRFIAPGVSSPVSSPHSHNRIIYKYISDDLYQSIAGAQLG